MAGNMLLESFTAADVDSADSQGYDYTPHNVLVDAAPCTEPVSLITNEPTSVAAAALSLRNLTLPVHKLPVEVLSLIFTYAREPAHHRFRNFQRRKTKLHTELLLCLVCRRWRDVVRTTPKMWSLISFDPLMVDLKREKMTNLLKLHLERSKRAELNMFICDRTWYGNRWGISDQRQRDRKKEAELRAHIAEVFGLLDAAEASGRLAALVVRGGDRVFVRGVSKQLGTRVFPALRHLALDIPDIHCLIRVPSIGQCIPSKATPALKTLRLRNVDLAMIRVPYGSLETLELDLIDKRLDKDRHFRRLITEAGPSLTTLLVWATRGAMEQKDSKQATPNDALRSVMINASCLRLLSDRIGFEGLTALRLQQVVKMEKLLADHGILIGEARKAGVQSPIPQAFRARLESLTLEIPKGEDTAPTWDALLGSLGQARLCSLTLASGKVVLVLLLHEGFGSRTWPVLRELVIEFAGAALVPDVLKALGSIYAGVKFEADRRMLEREFMDDKLWKVLDMQLDMYHRVEVADAEERREEVAPVAMNFVNGRFVLLGEAV